MMAALKAEAAFRRDLQPWHERGRRNVTEICER